MSKSRLLLNRVLLVLLLIGALFLVFRGEAASQSAGRVFVPEFAVCLNNECQVLRPDVAFPSSAYCLEAAMQVAGSMQSRLARQNPGVQVRVSYRCVSAYAA